MIKNRRYGFLTPDNDHGEIQMNKGQNIAGYPIGIIYIEDVYYPMLPGNVVNAFTYDFPVRMKAVKGLDVPNLFQMGDQVYEHIIESCEELEREGVRAISSACGFFGNYQKQIAKEINLPIALSSLIQIPWILSLLKDNHKIGVITADASSLTEHIFNECGISQKMCERLVIKDAKKTEEFNCVIYQRGSFNNTIAKQEIVNLAKEIIEEEPEIGAILLECSDMPPYAYAVQEAVQLPVFDFITLINWLKLSVCQSPYVGYI